MSNKVHEYKNTETDKEHKYKNKVFLFVGRTASGKSSIARAVCDKLGLKLVKSYTTRPARPGELEGDSDHYFITNDTAEEMIELHSNDIVAYTEIKGNKYFTTKEVLDKSNIYVIDPKGIEYLKEKCGDDYDFITIYFRIPYITSAKRFVERGGTNKDFVERYDSESLQFGDFEKNQLWDYHLLNDGSFEAGVDKICSFINKELGNESRT